MDAVLTVPIVCAAYSIMLVLPSFLFAPAALNVPTWCRGVSPGPNVLCEQCTQADMGKG